MHHARSVHAPKDGIDLDEIDELWTQVYQSCQRPVLHVTPDRTPAKEGTSSAEMMRRRRNFFQRKRMHAQQESIKFMRVHVQALEQLYEALCSFVDASQTIECQGDAKADQRHEAQANPLRMGHLLQRIAGDGANNKRPSFYTLTRELHDLIHENRRLRELIEQHSFSEDILSTIVDQAKLDKTINSELEFQQFGRLCFIPFSADECFAMIRKDLAEYVTKRPDFDDPTINKPLLFGWRGCVHYESSTSFRFQTVKEWPGTAQRNCEKIWKYVTSGPDGNHVCIEPHVTEVLQVVSPDIVIVRRRVALKEWTSWSVFLMYQSRFEDGCLFGVLPLPLWGNGHPATMIDDAFGNALLHDHETMAIRPLHFLFEPIVRDKGEVCTRVCRWGSSSSGEAIFMSLFEFSAVEAVMRYEHLVAFPVVKLEEEEEEKQ